MHEAKTGLSRLVAAACAGEPFAIARAGRPLVRVEAIRDRPETSRLDILKGVLDLPEAGGAGADGEGGAGLLLDTRVWLWAATAAHRLPAHLAARIDAAGAAPAFSAASLGEIARRHGPAVGAARLRAACLAAGYAELPVTGAHALAAAALPAGPRDPVGRILVAQARCEGRVLVTADPALAGAGARAELVRPAAPEEGG